MDENQSHSDTVNWKDRCINRSYAPLPPSLPPSSSVFLFFKLFKKSGFFLTATWGFFWNAHVYLRILSGSIDIASSSGGCGQPRGILPRPQGSNTKVLEDCLKILKDSLHCWLAVDDSRGIQSTSSTTGHRLKDSCGILSDAPSILNQLSAHDKRWLTTSNSNTTSTQS